MTELACGLALGALTGGLFFGALRLSVALWLDGAAFAAAGLQIIRLGGLALGLYAAARFGPAALLAAGAACAAARQAARA